MCPVVSGQLRRCIAIQYLGEHPGKGTGSVCAP